MNFKVSYSQTGDNTTEIKSSSEDQRLFLHAHKMPDETWAVFTFDTDLPDQGWILNWEENLDNVLIKLALYMGMTGF